MEATVIKHALTDGSEVYAVRIKDLGAYVVIDCYSEHDALKLMDCLKVHALIK